MQRTNEPELSTFGFHNRAVAGLVLVGLGLVFMLGNLTGFYLHNWWALFILIPGLAALTRAYDLYRAAGQVTPAMRSPLISGLVILMVAASFLLGMSWNLLWPLVLVLVGLGIFFTPSALR
ncbi:MAG: LiaF transmembrane domain-containing protein [Chloroflexota bacterium]